MWALRRASTNSLKARGLNITAFALVPNVSCTEDNWSDSELHFCKFDRWLTSKTSKCKVAVPMLLSVGCRRLSSHAGARSGIEELKNWETGLKDTLESELMGETVEDVGKIPLNQKYAPSGVFKLILEERCQSVSGALDKYVGGMELGRYEVYKVLLYLHRRKLYGKALQLSEWLERRKDFDFLELDYAYRLDLIAKVHGLLKAESYMYSIPKSFKEELVYRTLLANFVSASLVDKSEQLFRKMKYLSFPITVFTCNQMLLLYMRSDKSKISDVLLLMVKESLKPSLFTYKVLIDSKGQSKDIKAMEQIVEIMKADGLEPDMRVQELLARHYKLAGLTDKKFVIDTQILWDIFTNVYVDSPETKGVDIAYAFLQKKVKIYQDVRPLFITYMTVLREYAKRGDVDNAKKVFRKMKRAGFVVAGEPFDILLQAHVNAEVPTHGLEKKMMVSALRKKMMAGKVHPCKKLGALLSLVDVFKTSLPHIQNYWREKSLRTKWLTRW